MAVATQKYSNYFTLALNEACLFVGMSTQSAFDMNENLCPQHRIKGPNLINSDRKSLLGRACER